MIPAADQRLAVAVTMDPGLDALLAMHILHFSKLKATYQAQEALKATSTRTIGDDPYRQALFRFELSALETCGRGSTPLSSICRVLRV